MAAELGRLGDFARALPGPFPTRGWDGIALVQRDGRADDLRSPTPSVAGARPTPALAFCPYIRDVIASVPSPVLVARLLFLAPGGSAELHRDPIGFGVGVVRLHVPIVTHADVELWIGGARQRWSPGETWYGDFAFPHRLANPSPVTRVHLVLDVCVTEELLASLPDDVASSARRVAYLHRPAMTSLPEPLGRLRGARHIPQATLPGVAVPSEVVLEPTGGAIVARAVTAEGAPLFTLDAVGPRALCLRGYYPGVTLEVSHDDHVELVHRGRVRFADDADDDAPWDLHETRTALTEVPIAAADIGR
jgi:hypothetical protein